MQPVVSHQDAGVEPRANALWKMLRTGDLIVSQALLTIWFLILSGPGALLSLSAFIALSNLCGDKGLVDESVVWFSLVD